MLTPIEIQSKIFKTGMGYVKKDVDNYISEILSSYEILYKSNVELNDKICALSEGIQYYKTIEKTLQKALVLAEKTAEETKQSALRDAASIKNEAHLKAKSIIADAKNDFDSLQTKTIDLIRQYDMYKAQYKQLATSQIEMLNCDSFNINIANLNAFTQDNRMGNFSSPNEYNDTDYLKDSSDIHSKVEDDKAEDGFEFIGTEN